ncbi:DEAD/DEAH box helicase [Paremcibacter congregatus]|uniref:DEAD-box ATP-dependent RNA helicase RhpA n=1 Tax=Paremcibacter congregatus TaxID=2043170 RepID=A0A2G4YUA9_9PROT|nr:DEAD/DEAH box helicase [Paremcibacter congregatus]PHZ85873.1 DEAD/DEAH box helicase [Paremcibacter congregatus]QDE26837.1 DEAD/DEAH box helicase [Paremcibacter congregatus]|tara:strand:- start:5217 stop:6611 length:1395 start_codon:yes stop_codon:yes gene_type:complete
MPKFAELDLRDPILRAVKESGYEDMTPIQSQAIPKVLGGQDLIAVAQTGTGKTAAFSLPIIQMLLKGEGQRDHRTARSLILAPTRELAVQIAENIKAYTTHLHLRTTMVYGGASSKPQIKAMLPGVDILIATPGRLLDLVNQKHINLGQVEYLVLDEADRMLDMGFIRDIEKIIRYLPQKRQNLLFSATMPKAVEKLANNICDRPARIEVAPASTTAEKVEQHVLMVPKARKRNLLAHMLKDEALKRVIVFTRTKHGANRVATHLEKLGITSSAIHGNKSQNARQKSLNDFRSGGIRALVATDVAARGIDVDGITHVINYDLPNEPESYVHRIGRTARAGATGISFSFCDHEEREYLRDIEKIIRKKVPLYVEHPYHFEGVEDMPVVPGHTDEDNNGRPGAPRRRNNSGKHKPNRRINQPKAHSDKPGGSRPNKMTPKPKGARPDGAKAKAGRPANRRARPARG